MSQPHPAPQPSEPKKKGGCLKGLLIGLGVLALIIALAVSCGGRVADNPTPPPANNQPDAPPPAEPEPEPDPAPAEDTVRMVATSDSPGNSGVNWGEMGGGSTQSENFTGTWEKEVPASEDNSYSVTVSPDWMTEGTFTVTCELYVNGELVDEASATGTPGGTYATCTEPLW